MKRLAIIAFILLFPLPCLAQVQVPEVPLKVKYLQERMARIEFQVQTLNYEYQQAKVDLNVEIERIQKEVEQKKKEEPRGK